MTTPAPIQLGALRRGDEIRYAHRGKPRTGTVDLVVRSTVAGRPHVEVRLEDGARTTGPAEHEVEALALADRSATLDGRKTTTSSRARRGNRHDQRSALPRRADQKDLR